MPVRIGELRNRDVISVRDGVRIGFVGDIEIDTQTAKLAAVIVYGRPRLFGLLGHEEDCVISWESIRMLGEDAVLVDFVPQKRVQKRGFLANFWENP